jgi:hypothetical protein
MALGHGVVLVVQQDCGEERRWRRKKKRQGEGTIKTEGYVASRVREGDADTRYGLIYYTLYLLLLLLLLLLPLLKLVEGGTSMYPRFVSSRNHRHQAKL